MKILHTIHSVDPHNGGPSTVIRNLVRQQTAAGHRVALLTTVIQSADPWQPRDAYKRAMLADSAFAGAEVHLADAFGRRKPWSTFAFSPDCNRWLRRRLSDSRQAPDLVHIHGIFSHLSTLAARHARERSIPYLVRPAGALNGECLRMGSCRMKRVFARLFHKKDFQQAACVQSTSPQETEELCCWVPRQRIRQIPNGVNVESIDSAEAARLFRKKFPLLRGRKVVLFLGRITPKKRPEMLVEAVAQLRSEFPDLTLVLAGCDDGHTAAVRTAVARFGLEDSVLEAGFLQGELKQGVFAVADLFALPSIDENFGIAVIEAMAHAVPVLLTSGVAAHVYVSQSGGGATVDGTAEAFADGMRKLLKSDLKEMGRKGQAFVKQNLSWCAVNRQLERLYRQILA